MLTLLLENEHSQEIKIRNGKWVGTNLAKSTFVLLRRPVSGLVRHCRFVHKRVFHGNISYRQSALQALHGSL